MPRWGCGWRAKSFSWGTGPENHVRGGYTIGGAGKKDSVRGPYVFLGRYFRHIPYFLVFLALSVATYAAPVGIIEYLEGEVSLTRGGRVEPAPEIGDSVENFDFLKTGPDGKVVIVLDRSTGLNGTLSVRPRSVFSIKVDAIRGAPETEADMLAGSVAVKAKKISGSPALRVRTTATTMGIRGTEFEVAISVNDSLLVTCSEGAVSCSGDGEELEAAPGQSVVRTAGERLRRVPVSVSRLDDFRRDWLAEEIAVFSAAPLRALDQYASMYRRQRGAFLKAFEALSDDPALAEWMDQARRGVVPRSTDVRVMRQKSALVPKLMAVRGSLFIFERVYYRLVEIKDLIGPESYRSALRSGGTVSDFYRELAKDGPGLEEKTAVYRFALRLYAERNDGRDAVSLGASDDAENFFDDPEDFFEK